MTPGTVTYSLDGTPIIQTTTEATDGRVALGYADLFTSIGPHFVIFDNLEVVPEPSCRMLLALASLGVAAVRKR